MASYSIDSSIRLKIPLEFKPMIEKLFENEDLEVLNVEQIQVLKEYLKNKENEEDLNFHQFVYIRIFNIKYGMLNVFDTSISIHKLYCNSLF